MTDQGWAKSFNELNTRSLQRLRQTVDRLGETDLRRAVSAEWTVSATLAHLAWWDQYLVVRWRSVIAGRDIPEFPGFMEDVINDATTPQWVALPPAVAAEQAVAAAESANACIAGLPPEQIAFAIETGRRDMLDRSRHRDLHLDDIDRGLAG